ncbi:MAG TPA: M48 family metalloprotease, partial [Spirochaetota bacterium]|nr:M48 family metalloprotease [Spirochaetota bacterium]
TCGSYTYLIFATVLFFFSVLLARVAPVVLFPLFYKFVALPEGEVRSRLSSLLDREKIAFKDIFSFNMSKNTRKANAAMAGIGKSRRIILSDTLLESFTPAEIESVFAHEVGHYRHKHIPLLVCVNGILIYLSFFLCGLLYSRTISLMGFLGESDIAALPILILYLSAFGLAVMPLSNMLSRRCERQADAYAIESTKNPEAFISAMERLASMNLSEKQPHPLVEFFFHGHPSIAKRIAFARTRITSSREAGE